jgi:hypothetical protein
MIIRWISDVPSKIVKILAIVQFPQVSGLRVPVVSARIQHAPPEMNNGSSMAGFVVNGAGCDLDT